MFLSTKRSFGYFNVPREAVKLINDKKTHFEQVENNKEGLFINRLANLSAFACLSGSGVLFCAASTGFWPGFHAAGLNTVTLLHGTNLALNCGIGIGMITSFRETSLEIAESNKAKILYGLCKKT